MNYFADLNKNIEQALSEDINSGDITANLIKKNVEAVATITANETAIVCGRSWFDASFKAIDKNIVIEWFCKEGDEINNKQIICKISGNARALLTAERTALNFLQTLSATATTTNKYIKTLRSHGLHTQLLDTRKTLPGLRLAQKYAVKCGGGTNHRIGLYDAILIKENHILSAGGIQKSILKARRLYPNITIEIEVETIKEMQLALKHNADIIMLDNFSLTQIIQAVKLVKTSKSDVKLEVSGNVKHNNLLTIAKTGVDYISTGAITKNIKAVDYSMRLTLNDINS